MQSLNKIKKGLYDTNWFIGYTKLKKQGTKEYVVWWLYFLQQEIHKSETIENVYLSGHGEIVIQMEISLRIHFYMVCLLNHMF